METNKIETESITLRNSNGSWLAQILISSDGFFAAISDYGNFSFAWRSYGDEKSLHKFKQFLLSIDVYYFSNKMVQGISYIAHGRNIQRASDQFSEMILPELHKKIKLESE